MITIIFLKLIDERDKFQNEGRICVIRESYSNGGAVGVQYEFKG